MSKNKLSISFSLNYDECEVCKNVPTGVCNSWVLEIGDNKISICSDCLDELTNVLE